MLKKEEKIIISLGDDGAIVSCFQADRLIKRMFVTSPLSSDFLDTMKSMPKAVVYLLLDTIDQNYIFSSIPNVGKSNVNKIVKRKITTEFDPNDINAYLFLGKDESSAKKTLKYLFVSVRSAPPFKDWVEAINSFPNIFDGIYLLPVESENFIQKIRGATHGQGRAADEWEVFISYNRVGGFRQIVLRQGKLIFTRISQSVSLQTPDAVGRNISQEAANTLEYIRRIGFYDQTISIYIICAKEVSSHIEVAGIKQKDIFIYNPFDLAQKLNIAHSSQDGDKFGDVVFAANFAAAKKKILKLSTIEIAKAAKLRLTYNLISIIGFALIAILPLISLYFFYDGYSASTKIAESEKVFAAKNTELNSVKDFKKEFGIEPQTLLDIVKAKNELSSKDELLFYVLKKYREADTYSSYLSSVSYSSDLNSDKVLILNVAFDYSVVGDYSDVLEQIEQYTTTVKAALSDYEVEFKGLPSEKDIKVDFAEAAKKSSITNVEVKIIIRK